MFPTLNHFLQYAFGFELPINLPSYGIIFAFSLFLSAFVLYLELKRKNREGTIKMPVVEKKRNGEIATSVVKPVNLVADFLFLAVIWGIIGSKVFHILENASEFAKDPAGMIFSFQGFSFYGGLIAAAIAITMYSRKRKMALRHLLDVFSPTLILAYGVGRMACQVSGDGDWGIVNTLAKPGWIPQWLWAYNYPHNVINAGVPIPGCAGEYCHVLPEGVFPTPVYETLMCVTFFIILMSLRKRLKPPGMLFGIYLLMNGTERFLIEKIRVNNKYDLGFMNVTQAEIVSTIIFLCGVLFLFWLRKIKKT